MSLTKIDVFKPLPRKFILSINNTYLDSLFEYKKHTDINKVLNNLSNINDEILFSVLDIFSKNHYMYSDILYYNLQTVEKEINLDTNNISGSYILTKDQNSISYETLDDAYHESLHCASTFIDKEKDIIYSGFSVCIGDKITFGEGITDGYIELLCQRDLHNNKVVNCYDKEKDNCQIAYCYSNAIARQLEIIIGKEKMEELFFKVGLKGLIEFLSQYKSSDEVLNFIRNCDAAVLATSSKSILLKHKTLQAQEFLFDICRKYFKDKKELLKYEKLVSLGSLNSKLTTSRIEDEIKNIKSETESIMR